jgi:hypothetical protein
MSRVDRTHGYEYAIKIGRGLITHTSALHPANRPVGPQSPFTLRPATFDDLPVLARLVLAPRAGAEIFTGGKDTATLYARLRWLIGDRPAAYPASAYPVEPFFVLEKRGTPAASPHVVAAAGLMMFTPGGPTANVHPLLWDGVEDASAVTLALVPALIDAVKALPAADGSPSKCV